MRIDHFMYAFADLDEGIRWTESVFGVTPASGGSHSGLGTRNALLSLGDCYLEIIAPDPAQSLAGTNGEKMAALSAPGLVTWAAEGDLPAVSSTLGALGIASRGPIETRREQPDGETLVWDLLFPNSGCFGVPFFIDWKACANPATTSPRGGTLTRFEVRVSAEAAPRVQGIVKAVGLPVEVTVGSPDLCVVIEAKNGVVELSASEGTRSIIVN